MATITNTHRSFLQGMLSRGAVTEESAREIYRQAAEAASPSHGASSQPGAAHSGLICENTDLSTETQDFSAFVSTINKRLKPLSLELATVRMESSGEKWVGVVNRAQDAASKLATTYTLAELEFFRKAVCVISVYSPLFLFLPTSACANFFRWNTLYWKGKEAWTA